MIEIREMLAPVIRTGARSGRSLTGFLGVTIHNTGNTSKGADAVSHARYLQGTGKSKQASWHYCVDENRATRSVPETEIAWHAGDGSGNGNMKTIAIEICMNADGDIRKATDNAAVLAADILRRHGISRADGHLFQHNHWSGKNCPQMIRAGVPYGWPEFMDRVQAALNGTVKESEGKDMAKRYDKIEELPKALQKEAQELVDCGALAGGSNGLDVTEDMIRVMIVNKRYVDLVGKGKN